MTNTLLGKIIYTIYSDTNNTYLCWDDYDKYYYWGQESDDNVICFDSLGTLNSFYAVAIKSLSVMKLPNLCPRCAMLYRNN